MIENHGVLSINVIPSILALQAFEVNKWKSGNGSLKPTVRNDTYMSWEPCSVHKTILILLESRIWVYWSRYYRSVWRMHRIAIVAKCGIFNEKERDC